MITKQNVHAKCLEILQHRFNSLEKELGELRKSQNSETKSSAGDKYETTREMINMERNNLSERVAETSKLMNYLNQLNPKKKMSKVESGAFVETEKDLFYVSAALGVIEMEEQKVFVISPGSPIGQIMLGKSNGDVFQINNMKRTIRSIE